MDNSFKSVLIVFAGSGLGGVARFGIQTWVSKMQTFTFPLATFAINILGCFLIGLFYALSEKQNMLNADWRLALTTGLCGGFTTFSAFGYENLNLLRTGNYFYFGAYAAGSVLLGVAAVYLGVLTIK